MNCKLLSEVKKILNKKQAFSLVELVISVAIIGILASIAVPGYIRKTQRANRNECINTLGALRNELAAFGAINGYVLSWMYCPKTWGLHVSYTAPSVSMPTIPAEIAPTYCKKQESASEELFFPWFYEDYAVDERMSFIYSYRIRAVKYNSTQSALDSAPPWAMPIFGPDGGFPFPLIAWNGKPNKIGKLNPMLGTGFVDDALMSDEGLIIPDLSRPDGGLQFLVRCVGNLDDDADPDLVIMDHAGHTFVGLDDI